MIVLATAANQQYMQKIRPYLQSLGKITGVQLNLICVRCGPPDYLPELPHIRAVTLTREQNYGAPGETESPQHGAWLQAVPGKPDDVCIFTDGDVICQRDFSRRERADLERIPEGMLWATYNSGPRETLAIEGDRLLPKVSRDGRAEMWRGYEERPCFNVGVLVGRRSTLEKLHAEYLKHWPRAGDTFGHCARQQWLMCWVAAELGMKVIIRPYSWHANGHYGVPPGVSVRRGFLVHDHRIVLFRHRL